MYLRVSAGLLCLFLQGGLVRAQHLQTWGEVDLAGSWRNVDFLAPFLTRCATQLPNPQFAATGILADFHIQENLTLTGGYLFVDLPQFSWLVNAPLVAVSESVRIKRLRVSDRNRFEKLAGLGELGKLAGLGFSPVRYRNRLLLDLPLGPDDKWHVFAEDEVFYDFAVSRWNQNRLRAGGGVRLSKQLFLDVYFMEQNTSGPASEIHVVGSTLRVLLTRVK
jgi:Protein of unknown function (DUF2490)